VGRRRALLILVAVVTQACAPISPSPDLASPTPVSSAFLDHIVWRRLGAKELPGLPALEAVAAGGHGLVAAGGGAFWVSDDANTWRRETGNASPNAAWRRLRTTPGGAVIAIGNELLDAPVPLLSRVTAEGIDDLNIKGPGSLVGDVTEFGDHLVAVGGEEAGGLGIVWTSQDGSAWSRAPAADIPLLTLAASNEARLVVAEIWSAPELGNGRLRFWQSSDGIKWVGVATFPNAAAADMISVPAGFLAVGDAQPPNADVVLTAAAWSSPDGTSWVPMSTPAGEGPLNAVTTWRGVPIAVGWTFAGRQGGVVVANRDGQTWADLAGVPFDGSRLYGVAVVNDRLVIVGGEAGMSSNPVVLIGEAPG
jgi:hypothetical protein